MTLIRLAKTLVRPSTGCRLLFTYGPALSPQWLEAMGITPNFITVARYESRKWMVNADGKATIVPRRGHQVFGVIYEIAEVELTALDIRVGLPHRSERYAAFARTTQNTLAVAEFYASRCRTPGVPTPAYLRPIVARAQELRFPASYVDELRSWEAHDSSEHGSAA